MFITAFPDLNVTNEDLVAEGDFVMQRWTSHVTHNGPLLGNPPTGKKVTLQGINLFRINNGKIAERWGVFDAMGLMQQLGVVPGGPGGEAGPASAAQSGSASSIADMKAVYTRFVEEVINQGNVDIADQLFSPAYVDHNAPPGAPPGLEGVKAVPRMFRGAFPDVHFNIVHMVGEGDRVGTYVTGHGTNTGPFMGIPATGKEATWESTGIFRVADGKIVEHWGIPDLMGLMQQLGLIPPPGQGAPPAGR
jgi:predicted ester cyclase